MAQLITDLNDFPPTLRAAAVTVGNFDGVHRGHARLIGKLVAAAKQIAGPAIVLTFDPPPQAILAPERPLSAPLTPIQRRAELLAALGVDALIAYPTDTRLLALTATEFFEQIIVAKLRAQAIVEGPNFRFGHERAGDTQLLAQLCQTQGIAFSVAEAAEDARGMISSTRIRGLISAGDIEAANAMLTEAYEISGLVCEGARRGRELGFPTANLTNVQALVPADGVYAGQASVAGRNYAAAINIGPNPTFDEQRSKVEVHLIGWDGSLYGNQLRCKLIRRIREIRKFGSLSELREQIARDVQACAQIDQPL